MALRAAYGSLPWYVLGMGHLTSSSPLGGGGVSLQSVPSPNTNPNPSPVPNQALGGGASLQSVLAQHFVQERRLWG